MPAHAPGRATPQGVRLTAACNVLLEACHAPCDIPLLWLQTPSLRPSLQHEHTQVSRAAPSRGPKC